MSDHHQHSASMEDLENPLLSTHHRSRNHFAAVGHPILKSLSVFLVLALIFSSLLVIEFIFISNKSQESNIESAVISRFNVSMSFQEVKGSWNVTLSLNEDVTNFKYEGLAWVGSGNDEFMVVTTPSVFYDSNNHRAFGYGNFTTDVIGPDEGRWSVDLFVEANVTYSHRLWSERREFVTVDCNDLEIEFDASNVGALSGDRKSCRVQTFPSKSDYLCEKQRT